jgi:sulfhydrogenase subunit beta (sulfur reductase)
VKETTQRGRRIDKPSYSKCARLAHESELKRWLADLVSSGIDVVAPVELEPGYLAFRLIDDANRIVVDAGRTITSCKSFYHPPVEEIAPPADSPEKHRSLIFGVHACDLNGMKLLAGALLSAYSDPQFKQRVEETLVVSVTCLEPAENCFCTSMGTGPSITDGFDLLITKLGSEYFIEIGTDAGSELLANTDFREADENEWTSKKEELLEDVRLKMPKQFKTLGVPELLAVNYDHKAWDLFADRCLGCANCTMVCPTCFCYDIRDWATIDLEDYGRSRFWDSCQSFAFSSVHGGNFRPDQKARLRQFVCHKLAFWIEQYGRMGCVGCGRCMTWCPTGIDLTDIVNAIREEQE